MKINNIILSISIYIIISVKVQTLQEDVFKLNTVFCFDQSFPNCNKDYNCGKGFHQQLEYFKAITKILDGRHYNNITHTLLQSFEYNNIHVNTLCEESSKGGSNYDRLNLIDNNKCKCSGLRPSTCFSSADIFTDTTDVDVYDLLILFVSGNINEDVSYDFSRRVLVVGIQSKNNPPVGGIESLDLRIKSIVNSFSNNNVDYIIRNSVHLLTDATIEYINDWLRRDREANSCPELTNGEWGTIVASPNNRLHSIVVYTCAIGYMVPDVTAVCMYTEENQLEWVGELNCIPTPNLCPELTDGVWGSAISHPNNEINAYLKYTCAIGYIPPENRAVCQKDTNGDFTWAGDITCSKNSTFCPKVEFGEHVIKNDNYPRAINDKLQFTCEDNYYKTSTDSICISVGNMGIWSVKLTKFCSNLCPNPESGEWGEVNGVPTNELNSILKFNCYSGYTRPSLKTICKVANGVISWVGPTECEKNEKRVRTLSRYWLIIIVVIPSVILLLVIIAFVFRYYIIPKKSPPDDMLLSISDIEDDINADAEIDNPEIVMSKYR